MANKTSALEVFFKLNEGLDADDKVAALYDVPDREMRLYCIRISEKIVILGGGAPKYVRAWQHDLKLRNAVEEMMFISRLVHDKIDSGELYFSEDDLFFKGNLFLI